MQFEATHDLSHGGYFPKERELVLPASMRRTIVCLGWRASLAIYHLVMTNSLPWKDPPFLIGKPSCSPSINGPFSMAMLNNQRVYQVINFYHLGGDPSSCSARVCDWLAIAHSHLTCAKWCKKNGGDRGR